MITVSPRTPRSFVAKGVGELVGVGGVVGVVVFVGVLVIVGVFVTVRVRVGVGVRRSTSCGLVCAKLLKTVTAAAARSAPSTTAAASGRSHFRSEVLSRSDIMMI